MTHVERVYQAVRDVAATLPGFDDLNPQTQQILLELGEQYFEDEYIPRLEGIVNLPRYQEAMHEKTWQDREFIEDQLEFLTMSMEKAQRAAHEQLLEKFSSMTAGASKVKPRR